MPTEKPLYARGQAVKIALELKKFLVDQDLLNISQVCPYRLCAVRRYTAVYGIAMPICLPA